MDSWEYKVVPAPTKGQKGKGIKGAEARFAFALETLMNDMAGAGWEFQRAETLPSIERSGLTGSTTEWRNILVFRRAVRPPAEDIVTELLPAPTEADPASDDGDAAVPETPDTAEVADTSDAPRAAETSEDAETERKAPATARD